MQSGEQEHRPLPDLSGTHSATAKEGGDRRTLTLSYLIRADDTGARIVPWELLANLEAREPVAKPPHPARVSQAARREARAALTASYGDGTITDCSKQANGC